MEKTKLTAVVVAVIFGALSFLGLGAGAVIAGSIMGAAATVSVLPNKCNEPFNIFDAWDSFEGYLSGTDCNCPAVSGSSGGSATGAGNVSAAKIDYVETIIGVGNAMKVPSQGIIIALTVANVESNIQNYANDGVYDILRNPADATLGSSDAAAPILAFVKNSQAYPHDALGSDATSVGLFQQQAWWGTVGSSDWKTDPVGTMKRLMDPTFQAQKFYNSLLQVPGWQSLPDGVAAQKVQVSATPTAYQGQKESEAQALYNQYKSSAKDVTLYDLGASAAPSSSSSSSSSSSTDATASCSGGAGTTSVPLDKSASYIVTAPFGDTIWHPTPHAGMDIACHMGDTVYAPISGTVTMAVDGNPSGYGYPAGHVDIRTSDGTIFWLWHLRSALVKPGQQVKGGQPVGACGSTGDSTGPHLHIQAQIENTTNAQIKALPIMQGINPIETETGATDSVRDPALVLDILGVDICPPYVANRKTVPPGTPLPDSAKQCWPPNEWTK